MFRIIAFVLLFAGTVTLTGCDSGIYSAEKHFWCAAKDYNKLLKNRESASPVDYQKVIDAFREITIRYPMWPNSAQAQFNIAQIYGMQNNMSKAKDELYVILKDYPNNADICARALFMIALIYETEDNWTKAKESLDKITKDYPDTSTAFQVPIHIAQYHKFKGQNSEAEVAYAEALEKYKKVIKDNPKTYGALVAADLVITCYGDQGKWEEAIAYMTGIANDYPDTLLAPKALFTNGFIYEQKLGQQDKAIELYREVINKYSKTPFARAAQDQMEAKNKPPVK